MEMFKFNNCLELSRFKYSRRSHIEIKNNNNQFEVVSAIIMKYLSNRTCL